MKHEAILHRRSTSPATTGTTPGSGSVTFTSGTITYTPDEGFTSGSDTFDYTLKDGHGEQDTAEVTVTMVELSNFRHQWFDTGGNWTVIGFTECAEW